MKLHLPTALFALAVLPAVAFAEEKTYTIHDIKSDISNYTITPVIIENDPNTDEDDNIVVTVGAMNYGYLINYNNGLSKQVQMIDGNLSLTKQGDKITGVTEEAKSKLLYINGNLDVSGGATVQVKGHYADMVEGGIVANNVTVGEGALFEVEAALFNSLTVNGGKVTMTANNQLGGTIYGAGSDFGERMNAPQYRGAYEFGNTSITNGLIVSGGEVQIGRGPNGVEGYEHYFAVYQSDRSQYFRSNIGGTIKQTGGLLNIESMTYLYTDSIEQTGGSMTIAAKHVEDNADERNVTIAEYLRIGKDKMTITQGGDSDKTVLNLQGIIVKDDSGAGKLELVINQTGSGTINMETAQDSYRAEGSEYKKVSDHIGSYFTSEPGKESLISQSGSGQVNIGSDYQSATFNVEQKGEGSVTLKEHGVLRSSVVSINDKSTFTVAAGGKLMLNDGAQLNLTVGNGNVGLQVENGGSITLITSAGPDSKVVVNVLLTEAAMESNLTEGQLVSLLNGTADSLTFSVNIAQFGTDADAEAFSKMLTMTGNEQVLTYTPDVATFSGEGAVPTDLAITVTGFTNAEGMVQAQVSAKRYTAPVPEPATATLSLLALAGLCARRRRK